MPLVPLAHLGHGLSLVPFFGPPLLIAAALVALAVRDRLRGRNAREDGPPPADPR